MLLEVLIHWAKVYTMLGHHFPNVGPSFCQCWAIISPMLLQYWLTIIQLYLDLGTMLSYNVGTTLGQGLYNVGPSFRQCYNIGLQSYSCILTLAQCWHTTLVQLFTNTTLSRSCKPTMCQHYMQRWANIGPTFLCCLG